MKMTSGKIDTIPAIKIAVSVLAAITVMALFNGCGDTNSPVVPEDPPAQLFSLLPASETGIDFANNLRENIYNDSNVLSFENYYTGSGVAIGDLNNDGLPEVIFAGNTEPCRLYANQGDLTFIDITNSSGFSAGNFWTNGVTLADVNQDGLLDIYLANGGVSKNAAERQNLLFINQGDLKFVEQAAQYGVNDGNRSMHATYFDYDLDGDLDLYVMNHAHYWRVPLKYTLQIMQDRDQTAEVSGNLFQNNGNGTFTKVTEQAGLLRYGYGLGLVISDLNEDGWPDIYVANDYSIPDFMYINNGDGTFTDQINRMTRQITWFGMGCDIADINNDGQVDIAVVDMATSDHVRGKTLMASMDDKTFWTYVKGLGYQYQYMFNSLQINNGNGSFSNIANMAGVAKSEWSWSSLLADFDNDGYKDYFITNGIRRYPRDNDFRVAMRKAREENGGSVPFELRQGLYEQMPQIKLSNQMYRNQQDLTFQSVSEDWGVAQPSFSHGAAYGDLDGDGDLDLVVNNTDETAFVYRNNAVYRGGNHYLDFRLKGLETGEQVYNTKVKIRYADQQQFQELTATRGYLSAVAPVLHFGLGAQDQVDEVEITWPNGQVQLLADVEADQILEIERESNGNQPNKEVVKTLYKQVNPASYGMEYVHYENEYNDFAKEILLPHRQSCLGPFVASGDVNGDGTADVFVGGGKGQSPILYEQTADGRFQVGASQPWTMHYESEDMDAVFFDADTDGDLDLYVVSGGGGDFAPDAAELQDRLYLNNAGTFTDATAQLPKMLSSGLRAVPGDFDGDGDLDLFVGGRTVPGKYPLNPESYLLENNNGQFKNVTTDRAPELQRPGMVTDAHWTDFDQDGQLDLIVVGEWMAPGFYRNTGSGFENQAEAFGLTEKTGWWYSLAEHDLDGDGDMDYVLGNIGTNTKFNPKADKPLDIYCSDFDQNGSLDIVIGKYYQGKPVPLRGRECSSDQMPYIKDKFPTYSAFANASLSDILGPENLDEAHHLEAREFHSVILWNEGNGSWDVQQLPNRAQTAPINRIAVRDVNKDGQADILLAGNMYQTEVETPRYDAGIGLVLLGKGDRKFQAIGPKESGFFTPGDVKDFELITWGTTQEEAVLVTNNANRLQLFLPNRD